MESTVAARWCRRADARFKEGDPVIATSYDIGVAHDGGYAEYMRLPADWVVPLPRGMSLFESMALGTAGYTAGLAVVRMEREGLEAGQRPGDRDRGHRRGGQRGHRYSGRAPAITSSR